MGDDYFSIDAIAAEDERVPLVAKLDVPRLGFLDPANSHEDLPNGSKIELPLWLGETLHTKKMFDVNLPKHYNARFQEHLEAGPASTNLREHCSNYFTVGEVLSRVKRDDELQKKLRMAFSGERFKRIMDLAFSSHNQDVREESQLFTDLERQLFDAGYRGVHELLEWKSRKQRTLTASSAVQGPNAKRLKLS